MRLISAWTLFLGKLEKPSRCFSFINFAVTAGAKKGKFGHFPRKSARIFTEIVLFSIPRNQKQDPQVLTTITKAIIESGLDETKIVRTDVVFRFSSNTKYFASKTTQHFAKLPPPCPKLPMASHV